MADPIRFRDGASYDVMMGTWSLSVGSIFLDWIKPAAGLDWIDVGCGSGAFSSLIVERCAPKSVLGIDPSEAQLEFARSRGLGPVARFEIGDAMDVALPDGSVDAAVAALVVHFMPDPAKGVAEMTPVTKPGGLVATYAWDLSEGGFPYEAVYERMRAFGLTTSEPPHPEAAEAGAMLRLWTAAGLEAIAQREIVVTRPYRDFEHYWQTAVTAPRLAVVLDKLSPDALAELKDRVRAKLPPAADGTVSPSARANAISGRVPR
jgi:ubiquinone/menaquinone biosynthesis C-methylase UbiE